VVRQPNFVERYDVLSSYFTPSGIYFESNGRVAVYVTRAGLDE
jgi:hypothetical protein